MHKICSNILPCLFLFFSFPLFSQERLQLLDQAPKYEVRAVWLTTIGGIDWPHNYAQSPRSIERQKQELIDILNQLQRVNINTILLQTRIRGTVIYPSAYEPWDGALSGIPGSSPGYDALQFAIDECHKRGMELHCWVVTIPVGKWNGTGCKRLRERYPGLIKRIGTDGYMNPEDSRTANHLVKICKELTHNYDIDGIHLDYIRYPENWNIQISRPLARQAITNIVQQISQEVKTEKPWVKMSCSPIGKADDLTQYWSHGWNAYNKVAQDAQSWLRDGLMDALFPMMYFRANQFYPFAIDWQEQGKGKIIAPGLGIYFLNAKEGNWRLRDVTQEMYQLRHLGLGHTFFRSKFLTDNEQGIYHFTTTFNPYPSLIPPMTWMNKELPLSPTALTISSTSISWEGGRCSNDSPYPLYNVYASDTWPVDTKNARQLIVCRTRKTTIHLPYNSLYLPHYYAVTTLDRYGNESEPLQSQCHETPIPLQLLHTNGQIMTITADTTLQDVAFWTILDLKGKLTTSFPGTNKQLPLNHLAPGIYQLHSVSHKGQERRICFFSIGVRR